jgi:peptidoglycan/xylan/chitin deacetylase (PgdA/CDA1 family)
MDYTKTTQFFCSFIFILFFSSCTAISPSVQESFRIYKSEEYILCQLEKKSLSHLARIYLGNENLVWKIEDANDTNSLTQNTLVTIPLKDKNRGGLFEDGYQTVPILCYHKFNADESSPMNTPPHVFARQMKYLKDNGYRVISPKDLLNFLSYRHQIPKNCVLITIDDGFKSAYDVAWPILREHGFTATLFVYTDYVGISRKAITWDELRTLKTHGFTIGSHSVSHSDLTKKEQNETDEDFHKRQKKEIYLSKKIIDDALDQDTIFFSFPYGRHNAKVIQMTESAGYKMAVTVDQGSNPFFLNPLALKRNMILKKDMKYFVSRLKTFNQVSLK